VPQPLQPLFKYSTPTINQLQRNRLCPAVSPNLWACPNIIAAMGQCKPKLQFCELNCLITERTSIQCGSLKSMKNLLWAMKTNE
jgi:hypothetical protein